MNTPTKILIIGKEKVPNQLSILVQRQINTLVESDHSLHITKFVCRGHGVVGYLNIFKKLRSFIKQSDFHIIHAHYSFIGVLTLLVSKKENVVVSFMGTDVFSNAFIHRITRNYILKKAPHIIIKSEKMLEHLPKQKNISIIPNGVNIKLFEPMEKSIAKKQLGWDLKRKHILFSAGKKRFEKNFPLAQKAIAKLENKYLITLHFLQNIEHNNVPMHINAADIVLLTSRWEGSSNITKEAMACNTIVVSTDVGDARELFRNTDGYFIASHIIEDIVSKLEEAIDFIEDNKKPQGRQRIMELGLDEATSANKILKVYETVIEKFK